MVETDNFGLATVPGILPQRWKPCFAIRNRPRNGATGFAWNRVWFDDAAQINKYKAENGKNSV